MTQETDMRFSALEGRIAQLADRVDALSAENDRLRGLRGAGGGSGDGVAGGNVSRRGLLAAAVGATGALLVTRAAPAAAADGDTVLAGQETAATGTTRVVASTGHGLDGVTTSSEEGRAGVEGKASATDGLTYGMKGKSLSMYGVGVHGEAPHATGITLGVRGKVSSPHGTGVFGINESHSGETTGVWGVTQSPEGVGVMGEAWEDSGGATGVSGETWSTSGRGVVGVANANSGVTYGVYGKCESDSGFALYGRGRLKATGRCFLGAPAGRPNDNLLTNGGISFYLDPQSDRLKVRVKYPNGALKTGSIPLV